MRRGENSVRSNSMKVTLGVITNSNGDTPDI
jgi:hypothetical protein